MDYKVVYTKPFNGLLRGLQQQGQKKVVQAARAAISEAGMSGEIQSLPRTKHGETRIPNVEKYDLTDGHRLIVQLVDGITKTRAFLFVGSHDESDRWLDSHKNYRWIKNSNDGTLQFVQVTAKDQRHIPADRMDLESPEDLLALPLLRVLSPDQWERLVLPIEGQAFAETITGTDFERDADGLLVRLDQLAGYEKAGLVLDLLTHAHAQEWPQFHERINVLTDDAVIVPEAKVEAAMLSSDNGESFVTFDEPEDINNFFDNHSMADWMLFLHPEQKRVAERDFKGPARLRGISGSGKTSVLVHRARYLAKKYQQPVLMVTLTESMRKLLDHLSDDLCGVERQLLLTTTMSALARNVVNDLRAQSSLPYRPASSDQLDAIYSSAVQRLKQHKDFSRAPFHSMEAEELSNFIRDEICFVRCRLRSKDLHLYLDSHSFQRRGRGLGLSEIAREIVLDAIRFFEERLISDTQLDHEGVVAEALGLIESKGQRFNRPRCILCDEVQDLSHLELALLASIPTPDGASIAQAENGLFLAGDGAQTIYKRGFTLRRLGIDIVNRSFTLKKSYRNTSEILTAAFGLVSQYEFADVDEENVVRPSAPEFAKRHGQRPLILHCSSLVEEARVVAEAVLDQVNNGTVPGQVCIVGPTEKVREEVHAALTRVGIAYSDLRQDADYESVRVKVSTIESAKGHEFGTVFVMGLVEGLLPNSNASGADIEREAARLYVAMTRARDALTLSYSLTGIYTSPSRFLLAIQKDCDEAVMRGGQLRRLTGS